MDFQKEYENSSLCVVKYKPSPEFKRNENICVFANGYPFVCTGFANDEMTKKSIEEAHKIANSTDFQKIVAVEMGFDDPAEITFFVSLLDGNDKAIKYYSDKNGELFGIAKKKTPEDLLWVVLRGWDKIATAMCISKQIQKITEE
jgi:hypothetical protein